MQYAVASHAFLRDKDLLTVRYLKTLQHKATSGRAPLMAWRVPSPSAPQLTPPGPISHPCGHCWLLGCTPTPFSQTLGQAPGLKEEPMRAWEGCAQPHPTANTNTAGHGQLLLPSWPPLTAPASLSGCWEGFRGFWLTRCLAEDGVQEAASRLILLIIHRMQDGVEN